MALGFVRPTAELLTCWRGITPVRGFHQLTSSLLYRLPLMLVFGVCVWKWTTSVATLDPDKKCIIGFGYCSEFGMCKETWQMQKFRRITQ